MSNKLSLQEQAKEVLRIAQEHGVEQNFFFITTFKRYQVQINILTELEKKIQEDGALVTKEYVKGRKNVYTHPAISEYNKTCTSANQTVATLIKISIATLEITRKNYFFAKKSFALSSSTSSSVKT
jgi:hypothetical protein